MPRVSPLNSQAAFRSQASGVVCNIAGFSEGFHGSCRASCPSRHARSFCPPFGGFLWAVSNLGLNPPESRTPCWCVVATGYPLGNRDSLRVETHLSYLTRLGTVSNHSSPLSPLIRVTDGARTPPEELVNPASGLRALRRGLGRGRANQPGPTFPQSPGFIFEKLGAILSFVTAHLSSFNELKRA